MIIDSHSMPDTAKFHFILLTTQWVGTIFISIYNWVTCLTSVLKAKLSDSRAHTYNHC